MGTLQPAIVPAVVVIIIVIILSIVFKDRPKTDKGFQLFYFKLSYRRKVIRTLITSPIAIFAIGVIYYYTNLSMPQNIILGLVFFILYTAEVLYNIYMWKTKEK